ncbi:MAG: hypothetical protein COA79_13975 [Planctomycetota bacterium]|nr:MAG: hypothetical protein COA79_13975 [Planctomycetota bacterium]
MWVVRKSFCIFFCMILGLSVSLVAGELKKNNYWESNKEIKDAIAKRKGKTELSKLALKMKPGTWAKLDTIAPAKLWRVGSVGRKPHLDIHGWTDDGAWDSRTGQFIFMGFRLALKCIAYSEETNEWRTIPERFKWPRKNAFGHIYSNNAHDFIRGVYYHHIAGSKLVYGYDLKSKKWEGLPPIPMKKGKMASSLEYFPELGGLVRHGHDKKLYLYNDKKKNWSTLGQTQVCGYHSMARYNSQRKELLLAGGGGSPNTIEVVDSKGNIKRLDDCPSELNIRGDKLTYDPVSGRYLIIVIKDKKFYELDSEKNEYRLISEWTDNMPISSYAVCAPIPEYGVIMFAATERRKGVMLYKHKISENKPLDTQISSKK